MDNPFESGHIKNYVLAYTSIVVIMILFFIASSLFLEEESVEKKEFKENKRESVQDIRAKSTLHVEDKNSTGKFKIIDTGY